MKIESDLPVNCVAIKVRVQRTILHNESCISSFHTSWRALGSSASTDGPTPTEKLAIFRLDQLNDTNFFNLADFLWAISLDVCGIFGIMAGDDSCDCYPVSVKTICGGHLVYT